MSMNLVDVFNRKKKAEFTPLSLFPADSKCLTSLPIGRAVPVYRNSLIQGNKITLDADGLARLMTMNAPVLNDYKLVLSAYFVPYTSFDDFFKSTYMRNKIYANTANVGMQSRILHAREFFDGATPATDRVHPISVQFKTLAGTRLVGSLADHLGYYIGSNAEPSLFQRHDVISSTYAQIGLDDALNLPGLKFDPDDDIYSTQYFFRDLASAPTSAAFNIDAYACLIALGQTRYLTVYDVNPVYVGSTGSGEDLECDPLLIAVVQRDLLGKIVPTSLYQSADDPKLQWRYWFGDTTVSDISDSYYNYLRDFSVMIDPHVSTFSANVIPWLTYHRIYSDYFLNENLIDAEDFRDVIGEAYLNKAMNPAYTLGQLFHSKNDAKYSTEGNFKLKSRADLAFFANFMARGECLPIPWAKDYYTNAQVETTSINNGTPFTNFDHINRTSSLNNGGATTPVGTTINEFRFNKIYAKFKDLVARFGYSYKKNTGAIYGHTPSDDTLNRSQSLGMKSFTVNVGSVMQTSSSTDNSTLGSFAGVGACGINANGWDWTADESGEFMVLAWVEPTNVANVYGVDRSILKTSYYDYLLPQFGGIDYQDMTNAEVYPTGTNDGNRFAYVERYWEYMMSRDTVTGEMRNKYIAWSADRFLKSRPSVSFQSSPEFFYMCPSDGLNRPFMDMANDPVICKINFRGTVTRQLPEKIMTDL